MSGILDTILSLGFDVTNKGDEGDIVLSNGTLRVAIFPISYPHSYWRGKILAEHEDSFDKWSKHYYMVDIPELEDDINIVIEDLIYIDNKRHANSSNGYSTLRRTL